MEIGTFEAKNRLSELLTLAEKGQRIYITRRGKRVAMLTSAEVLEPESGDGVTLLEEFRAFRKSARPGPETLRELIEEGR